MRYNHAYLAYAGLVLLVASLVLLNAPRAQRALEDIFTPSFVDVLPVPTNAAPKASVSLGDYDSDGLVDIFVTTNERGYLYKNTNGAFGRVADEEAGTSFERVHMGVWGDVDNDGCKDLFVTRQSRYQYGFYKNNCDGSFTEHNERIIPPISHNGYGASFIDLDHDGFLDVYAVSFDRDNHKNFRSDVVGLIDYSDVGGFFNPIIFKDDNVLLLQKNGIFTRTQNDAYEVLGGDILGSGACMRANHVSGAEGRDFGPRFGFKQGYQPVWFDADGDGILDVMVTYDFGFSALYKQAGDGSFADITDRAGLCKLGNAMGVAVGDIDNDGDFDIYETNIGSNYLFINDGTGSFEERGAEAGSIDYANSGWGVSFADFNNDTRLDIIVSNGYEVAPQWPYDEMDKLFLNKDGKKFDEIGIDHLSIFDITPTQVFQDADAAAATGDLNNDGFPDAVIFRPHTGVLYVLYGKPNGNHWLAVSLEGRESNRDGIGAIVVVESGGVRQTRIVTAGSSYLSQDDTRQLFGLGRKISIDSIIVSWPSGVVDTFRNVRVDQEMVVVEGSGE